MNEDLDELGVSLQPLQVLGWQGGGDQVQQQHPDAISLASHRFMRQAEMLSALDYYNAGFISEAVANLEIYPIEKV